MFEAKEAGVHAAYLQARRSSIEQKNPPCSRARRMITKSRFNYGISAV
jgi:hypothetical protein